MTDYIGYPWQLNWKSSLTGGNLFLRKFFNPFSFSLLLLFVDSKIIQSLGSIIANMLCVVGLRYMLYFRLLAVWFSLLVFEENSTGQCSLIRNLSFYFLYRNIAMKCLRCLYYATYFTCILRSYKNLYNMKEESEVWIGRVSQRISWNYFISYLR